MGTSQRTLCGSSWQQWCSLTLRLIKVIRHQSLNQRDTKQVIQFVVALKGYIFIFILNIMCRCFGIQIKFKMNLFNTSCYICVYIVETLVLQCGGVRCFFSLNVGNWRRGCLEKFGKVLRVFNKWIRFFKWQRILESEQELNIYSVPRDFIVKVTLVIIFFFY